MVCVVTAHLSFSPACPASRTSHDSAPAMARTASAVVIAVLVNRTKTCSPSPLGAYAGISSTTKSSRRSRMRPGGRVLVIPARSPEFVRHLVARAAEVLLRRIEEEVRDARRVQAGILLDLRTEARLLVLLLEERAPEGMEALIGAAL